MDDEGPESLRHQAAEARKDPLGEKEKAGEKKTLLIVTKLDAVKGWSATATGIRASHDGHGRHLFDIATARASAARRMA